MVLRVSWHKEMITHRRIGNSTALMSAKDGEAEDPWIRFVLRYSKLLVGTVHETNNQPSKKE
jgi:hypothetical protein